MLCVKQVKRRNIDCVPLSAKTALIAEQHKIKQRKITPWKHKKQNQRKPKHSKGKYEVKVRHFRQAFLKIERIEIKRFCGQALQNSYWSILNIF